MSLIVVYLDYLHTTQIMYSSEQVFNIMESDRVRGTQCNVATNQPTLNLLAEAYQQGSRCIEHGTRVWTNNRFTGFFTGSGCYQVSFHPIIV